jgi:hypothetical protein
MADNTNTSNLQRASCNLPPALQQLLDDVFSQCHVVCSDNAEASNVITRQLHTCLEHLVAAITLEFQQELGSNLDTIRASSDTWRLLGSLVEAINRHFQIRPRIMFVSDDEDMRSAAAAARGIRDCFTRIVELLSCDDDRASNSATFTILLMDCEGDAETSMRLAFLDIISRRVVAVKRPDERWYVTIDGDARVAPGDEPSFGSGDETSSGFDEVPTPLRHDDLDGITCDVCQDAMYHKEGDGHIVLLARQLKCPGVVGVTDSTPRGHNFPHVFHETCAQRWFIDQKGTSCPLCRHNFSQHIFDDVTAALDHDAVDNGQRVQWTNATNRRLAALSTILHLARETPPGISIARALVWSLTDDDQSVVLAAARAVAHLSSELGSMLGQQLHDLLCQRLSTFLQSSKATRHCYFRAEQDESKVIIARAISRLLFEALAHDVTCSASDDAIISISNAITSFAKHVELSHLDQDFFSLSGCGALVQALRSVSSDDAKAKVALAIGQLSMVDRIWCHYDLVEAGACEAVVHSLISAASDDAKAEIATAIGHLARHGLSHLVACGGCEAVAHALTSSASDAAKASISQAICHVTYQNFCGEDEIMFESRDTLAAADAYEYVAQALRSAASDEAKAKISCVIRCLARDDACRLAFITAGACCSVVDALRSAASTETKQDFLSAIAALASHDDSLEALLEAGVCEATVGALDSSPSGDLLLEICFVDAVRFLATDNDGHHALMSCGAFKAVVQALRSAAGEDYATHRISLSTSRIALIDAGCSALVAEGACEALVESLRSAASDDDANQSISSCISIIARNNDGCRSLLAAGALDALMQSLMSSPSQYAKYFFSRAIGQLVCNDDGRRALAACGAFETLVHALRSAAKDDEAVVNISNAISCVASDDDGRSALVAAGACSAVADALRSDADADGVEWEEQSECRDNQKAAIAGAVQQLARSGDGCSALVADGAIEALQQCLSSVTSEAARAAISQAIDQLARNDDGRHAIVAEGGLVAK